MTESQYVPFGEVFLEERNGRYNTPYKFNGKELDEEIEERDSPIPLKM